MKKKVFFNSAVFFAGAALLLILAMLLPVYNVLSVSSRKNPDEKVYSRPAAKNGFCISYTHSVNKGRVHDYYVCLNDGSLELQRTVFVSYGAGIPEPEETAGAVFTVLPEGYEISNLQRKLPKLVMAVGIIANHSIMALPAKKPAVSAGLQNAASAVVSASAASSASAADFSGERFLTDFFAPQTSLILETKRISFAEYILNKHF